MGCMRSNLSRLRNKRIDEQYDSIIQDLLGRGVIEKVNENRTDKIIHYLPHHGVINPQKTTTLLRVVYDASSKVKKKKKK